VRWGSSVLAVLVHTLHGQNCQLEYQRIYLQDLYLPQSIHCFGHIRDPQMDFISKSMRSNVKAGNHYLNEVQQKLKKRENGSERSFFN
jgi:hypothetical protein